MTVPEFIAIAAVLESTAITAVPEFMAIAAVLESTAIMAVPESGSPIRPSPQSQNS
jgi:hypothetical protein